MGHIKEDARKINANLFFFGVYDSILVGETSEKNIDNCYGWFWAKRRRRRKCC